MLKAPWGAGGVWRPLGERPRWVHVDTTFLPYDAQHLDHMGAGPPSSCGTTTTQRVQGSMRCRCSVPKSQGVVGEVQLHKPAPRTTPYNKQATAPPAPSAGLLHDTPSGTAYLSAHRASKPVLPLSTTMSRFTTTTAPAQPLRDPAPLYTPWLTAQHWTLVGLWKRLTYSTQGGHHPQPRQQPVPACLHGKCWGQRIAPAPCERGKHMHPCNRAKSHTQLLPKDPHDYGYARHVTQHNRGHRRHC
jgi:hypothetical protein